MVAQTPQMIEAMTRSEELWDLHEPTARQQARWMVRTMKARQLRTMAEFAEQEVVIPDGPYVNEPFDCDLQPYTRLLYDAIDCGYFTRFVITGPTQSGKTFSSSIIPLIYHIFEIGENVIFGLPDMQMAKDKWQRDIVPVIEKTHYRDLLPTFGAGSRGGLQPLITLRNGASIRFMTGGGGDKQRSHFSSRVLLITEVDGMDVNAGGSVETDKISQLEGRLRSWKNDQKRIYMECTLTTKQGRTYREIKGGSDSRIVMKCKHCRQHVTPERDHLIGWKEAQEIADAFDEAAYCCPNCGSAWTEAERYQANLQAKLIHKGQTIDSKGIVRGPMPRTNTLGFRWNAANNMFLTAGDVAMDMWKAARREDEENAEKECCQFYWAVPYEPPVTETTPLDWEVVKNRQTKLLQGRLPENLQCLVVGVDLGKYLGHYTVKAWTTNYQGFFVDYGTFEIPSDDYEVEVATSIALKQFRDLMREGYVSPNGKLIVPQQVWVDSGWKDNKNAVYAISRETNGWFRPIKGFGTGQQSGKFYRHPMKKGRTIVRIGEEYHIARLATERVDLVHINADYWKSWLHRRLKIGKDMPGSITFFDSPDKNRHLKFSKHLTAETQETIFVPDKGEVTVWKVKSRTNHFLDSSMIACAAAHFCGARLKPETEETEEATKIKASEWFNRQRNQRRQRSRVRASMAGGAR